LIWWSKLSFRLCALITLTLAFFASSLCPSVCVHDKLVASGRPHWLVEYRTKGEASLKAFAVCNARAAALRYLNNMVICVVGVYSSSSSPFALDSLTLLLHGTHGSRFAGRHSPCLPQAAILSHSQTHLKRVTSAQRLLVGPCHEVVLA
jgi:hypothetical protein